MAYEGMNTENAMNDTSRWKLK